ncbi:MAG: HDOD domain-containing protein, partial [Gemmatimonadetes bacterium]|nr:HDOD domain-containing protein [Gemmatimonadota bacterium]
MSGTQEEPAGDVDVLVARQPILDLERRVVGYELLYRSHLGATGAGGTAVEQMTSEVLAGTLADLGVERITEGAQAWVNFPRSFLVDRSWKLFDPRTVVLEVLETVPADREVLQACEAARTAGYRLALDDFVYDPARAPLLEFADTIKVDVLGLSPAQIRDSVRALGRFGKVLLAERVEDDAVRKLCTELGFTLFQGYFFARPETLSRKHLSVEQGNVLRLLNLLRDETVSAAAIEEAFGSDPSLSFKLLRLVNSAHFGGRDIQSIRHAVQLAGRDKLALWLGVLFVSSLARKGAAEGELVHMAVFRARLLELLASSVGRAAETGPLFMVGLFSTL